MKNFAFGWVSGLAAVVFGIGCAPELGAGEPGSLQAGLAVSLQAEKGGGGQGGNIVGNQEQINVSVAAVAAHAAGGKWVTVSESPALVDLLRLQDHAKELGFANLPEGRITQIRLYVADDGASNTLDKDGVTYPLTIPSGLQTGVKLKGPFELGACEYGQAVAILDLEKSILVHERGGHEDLILRPTIHKTDYEAVPADICDPVGENPGDEGTPGDDGTPGGDDGTPGGDDGTPGGDDGGDAGCPEGTELCGGTGSDDPTGTDDPSGDLPGDGTVDPGDGGDGVGDDTGTGTGDGTGGDGTDGTGGETGGEAGGDAGGSDPGDACAPILTEAGLIDPCA